MKGLLARTRETLKDWSFNTHGHVGSQIKKAQERLTHEFNNEGCIKTIKKLENDLNKLLEDEVIIWKQRPIISWLKEGDKNTRFFHSKASQKKRKNSIIHLKDYDGNWQEGDADIFHIVKNDFHDLFTTSSPKSLRKVPDTIHPLMLMR